MNSIGLIMLFLGALLFPIFMIVGLISIFNSDLRSHFGLYALGFLLSSGLFFAGIVLANKGYAKTDNTDVKEEAIIPNLFASNANIIPDSDSGFGEKNEVKETTSQEDFVTKEPEEIKDALPEEPAYDDSYKEKDTPGGNGENFNKYHNEENHNTKEEYVLNTDTLKIHKPECGDVEKIKPENYATSSETIEELMSKGYTKCGHCF